MGYGKIGGAYATIDDGNSAWEDLDVDWELDHLEQQDDRYNGEKAIGSVPVSSLKAHNRSVESNYQNVSFVTLSPKKERFSNIIHRNWRLSDSEPGKNIGSQISTT